ncbi:MAG: hypothetical protein C4293_01420 [Nitrospiraceae bacterium]
MLQEPYDTRSALFADAEHWFQRGRVALLGEIPCRPGCNRCCIGPFTITILDAAELQRGMANLNAGTRHDIREKAKEPISIIEREFPQLVQSSYLDEWPDHQLDRLMDLFADLPCPALASDGTCHLYQYRPVTCRTMGLPEEAEGIVQSACEVQTAVPIIRLSRALREQEDRLAEQEATEIASFRQSAQTTGEEMLLPYGFFPERTAF